LVEASRQHRAGRLTEAVACYRLAVGLMPDWAELANNLGVALEAQGRLEQAASEYSRALRLKPEYAEAHFNLGNALRGLGRLSEAVASYERALELKPDHVETHCNLGSALQDLGRLDRAMACYERALALKPDAGNPQFNRALLQLLRGDFAAGWRNFEGRWRTRKAPRGFPQPLWRGEPLRGARILLHAEQGLGDTLQFLRYVPLVQQAGGTVVLDVSARLRRLAGQLPGLSAVVASGEPLPPFDWQCPLMSLPLALGADGAIPAETPYLLVPEQALKAAETLSWPSGKPRVGLAWAGNPTHAKDRFRSMALGLLAPLFGVEGVRFFSLQMGPAAAERAAYADRLTDLAPATSDMADTAAQMTHLDLVITVDTAVAHLAGALGRPAWVLLSCAADWRWQLRRCDSPWYPTVRLFRQPGLGEWEPVVEAVRRALSERAAQLSM